MKQLQDLFKFSITTILLCLLISKSVYASEIKVMIDDKTEKAMYQEEIEGECPDADILPDTATNSGKCGDDLTWNYDGKETLTISGSGNMYDWDSADTVPWYSFRYSIKKISLPENLTGIGSYAFTECYIKSIDFPKDLKKLGEAAFWSCHELEQVILPDGLTEIGTQNFSDCYKLKKAVIPASVTTIASNTGGMLCNVFHSMNLKSVGPTGSGCSIEYGWTEKIPDRAFYGSSYITEIKLPAGLKKIGDEAFNAASVTEIIIPDGVESIGHSAFGVYGDLKHIVVPASVTKFGYNGGFAGSSIKTAGPIGGGYDYEFGWETEIPAGAFDQCYNLEYIRIPETITANNASYTNKAKLKTAGPIGGGYNVEFGWKKEIPKYGLSSFNSLESLIFPDSLKVIGDYAISSDYNLKSVKMPLSLETIGERAFYSCSSLESIFIPIGTIGSSAFEKCTKLSSVVLGSGVDTIGSKAFYACANLTTLELGENVKSIGDSAFYSCTSLVKLVLPENLETIEENAFNNCRSLKTLQMGNKVTYIGYNAFRYCTTLEEVTLSDKLEQIGDYAFAGCTSLKAVTISKSVTRIGAGCFSDDIELNSIKMGKNVCTIGSEAFKNCEALEEIDISKATYEIEQNAFLGCTFLKDVYYDGTKDQWSLINIEDGNESLLNATIHFINEEMDYKCGKKAQWKYDKEGILTISGTGDMYDFVLDESEEPKRTIPWWNVHTEIEKVVIDDGITSIGASAFIKHNNLSEVHIPKTVSEIGDSAFMSSSVKDIYYEGTKEEWEKIKIGKENELLNNVIYHYSSGGFGIIRVKYPTMVKYTFEEQYNMYTFFVPEDSVIVKLEVEVSKGASWDIYTDTNYDKKTDSHDLVLQNHGDNFYFVKVWDESREKKYVFNFRHSNQDALDSQLVDKTIYYYVDNYTESSKCHSDKYEASYDTKGGCMALGGFYEKVKWGGDLFSDISAVPNRDIALLAGALSAAAEGRTGTRRADGKGSTGDGNDGDYILQAYKDLGFKDKNIYLFSYPGTKGNLGSIDESFNDDNKAFSIAYTPIRTNRTEYYLLVVTVRGTKTLEEGYADKHTKPIWSSDFKQNVYEYVDEFREEIEKGFEYVLKQHPEIKKDKYKVKILINGHSLGGAAANLFAASINKSGYAVKNNIYAYTFGGLNSFKPSSDASSATATVNSGYENIHNIYNFWDSYGPRDRGDKLADGIGSIKGRFGHIDSFDKHFLDEDTKDIREWKQTAWNHVMPGYLYAIRNDLIGYERRTGRWCVSACPVDIEVYDGGKLVGRIVDNAVDKTVTTISMYVIDDVKYYCLPEGGNYEVKMIAIADGKMDCMIEDIGGENSYTKKYENIELIENKTVKATIEDNVEVKDTKLLVLNETGKPVKEVLENGREIKYSKYGDVLESDVPSDGNIPDGIWVAGVEDLEYDGTKQVQDFRVYDGTKLLTLKTDYTASYKNNQKVYTIQDPNNLTTADKKSAPQIILTMKGNYSGKETVYFSINPAPDEPTTGNEIQMSKVSVTAIPSQVYIGAKYTVSDLKTADGRNPLDFAVSYSGSKLTEDVDYKVAKILDAVNPGTATLVLKGLNAKGTEGANTNSFIGEKRIKFKINAYPMTGDKISITDRSGNTELSAVFNKSGAKPEIRVMFDDLILKEGRDYTLKYSGNTKYPATKASVTITGKGSFKDKVVKPFAITQRSFSEVAGITVVVADKAEAKKAGQFQTTVKVFDSEGKLLKSGMDYEKDIVYLRGDTELKKTDHPKAGEVLTVRVIGKGGYSATAIDAHYKILPAGSVNDIGKAAIKIKNQDYNIGESVTIFSQAQMEQAFIGKGKTSIYLSTDGGVTGDFMVVPGSYVKNIDKGTAKVTFMGINGYSGTKTVSFKIGTRSLKDIWKGWVRK